MKRGCIDEKKKLLSLHRLQQAAQSLQKTQYLFAGGKGLRSRESSAKLNPDVVKMSKVKIYETPQAGASYREE